MSQKDNIPLYTGKGSIFIHIITWGGYLILSTSIFSSEDISTKNLIIKNFISAIFYAIPVYVNIYAFLPNFYLKAKYLHYYASIALLLACIVPTIAYLQYFILSPTDFMYFDYFSLAHFTSIFVTATVIILISTSVGHTFNTMRNQELKQELKNYKLEAELKFLKTQVNPHFLFNSLNNIYSLAVTKSEETAPTILKLSEMMRYMIYDSMDKRVPLTKEIGYLRNYIELQQLKTAKKQNIEFKVTGNVQDVMIEPMLFIPMFENSFKHGNLNDTKNGWLKSSLHVEGVLLEFSISNTINNEIKKKDQVGGIGLENVKQRLHLLYFDKHSLMIRNHENVFTIDLKMNMS